MLCYALVKFDISHISNCGLAAVFSRKLYAPLSKPSWCVGLLLALATRFPILLLPSLVAFPALLSETQGLGTDCAKCQRE